MIIIIDFDDVIFNTGKFLNDYKKVFVRHGISDAQFDYPAVLNKEGKRETYNLRKHLEFIGQNFDINSKELEGDIAAFFKQNKSYVFRDAVGFLEKFRRQRLYLLSYADDEQWQMRKVKSSGLGRYFRKAVICSQAKSDSVCQLLKEEKITKEKDIVFIDDRVEHLEDVKKCHPGILTILLKRKEGRYNDKKNEWCDYEAKNLKEVQKIIKDRSFFV